MPDEEVTPIDRFVSLKELQDSLRESIELAKETRDYCQKACDAALLAVAELPKIQSAVDEIPILKARLDRVVLFQAWFPAVAIGIGIAIKLLFMR